MRRLVGKDYACCPAEKISAWGGENLIRILVIMGLSFAFWFLIDGLISFANFVNAGGKLGHDEFFVPDPHTVLGIKAIGILLIIYVAINKRV